MHVWYLQGEVSYINCSWEKRMAREIWTHRGPGQQQNGWPGEAQDRPSVEELCGYTTEVMRGTVRLPDGPGIGTRIALDDFHITQELSPSEAEVRLWAEYEMLLGAEPGRCKRWCQSQTARRMAAGEARGQHEPRTGTPQGSLVCKGPVPYRKSWPHDDLFSSDLSPTVSSVPHPPSIFSFNWRSI